MGLSRLRPLAGDLRNDVRFAWQTRRLPRGIAVLQIRSRIRARLSHDTFSLTSTTRPADLATLLRLASGRNHVVELGTGTAWTTMALAAAAPARHVTSFDPVDPPERERYLSLLSPQARARIELVQAPGADGPRRPGPVDFLYIDSSHEREALLAELRAWMPVLENGAVVVFDDYNHPDYPGVAQGVAELGLAGAQHGTMFVHVHRPTAAAG